MENYNWILAHIIATNEKVKVRQSEAGGSLWITENGVRFSTNELDFTQATPDLEAKTKEQRNFIKSLAEIESCDGDVIVGGDGITYKVDGCFDVDISFDTMKQIVEYLE